MTEILLGLGSNTDPEQNLSRALTSIRNLFGVIECSRWYESRALNKQCPNYLNLVIATQTNLSIDKLATQLKALELEAGRHQGCEFCPLDIDILTFGDFIGEFNGSQIPRADLLNHAHVLLPLAELYPDKLHPSQHSSYLELWTERQTELLGSQLLWPVQIND